MKKKKQEQSFSRWFAPAIGALLFVLVSIVATLFVVGTPSDAVFVTEPWQAPWEICTTEWVYPEEKRNDPELMQAVATRNLPVDEIIVRTERAMEGCYGDDGRNYSSHRDILIRVDSDETLLSDNEQIGNMIQQILSVVSSTEISREWGGIDLIRLTFTVEDVHALHWDMNYIQALRAYEAGLKGLDLFELGRVR